MNYLNKFIKGVITFLAIFLFILFFLLIADCYPCMPNEIIVSVSCFIFISGLIAGFAAYDVSDNTPLFP